MKPCRVLLLCALSDQNSTFSYQQQWPRHFASHPFFECVVVNVLDREWQQRLRSGWLAHTFNGDAIVLLHSVFSNDSLAPGWMIEALAARPQPKVFFIGNEYKLMAEKMVFAEQLRIALLISQTQSPEVHALYRNRLGCAVAGVPNTGLDESLFTPTSRVEDRPIDLGYRADDAPFYLGHRERREIADFFTTHAATYGLKVDISMKSADRFNESGWAAFLNRCKGQLGTEAGGDFFSLDDAARLRVLEFEKKHPAASFDETYDACLRGDRESVPLRIMSGRHVEAAGTGTVQILFEGQYDGFMEPDVHYIPLRKDFSNADEAVAKFRDPSVRTAIAGNAMSLAREHFTYDALLRRVRALIDPLL
ncbi:MAG TPA: glycosyltransferase [Vicinamibacterales bacterium]|nr:glycosyltransferase [Vicinamibacterales bacterium]